ncbi:MAG TPA: hypothetical protein P5204_04240 [Kiritimatiellia bacterium]|nr:hypothetical protein [Kiritimatiellia bacterium]
MSAAGAKAEQANARASFDAGLQAFAASNWPAASNAFLEAAAAAPAAKLDPAAAYYNAGLAAYAGGDLKAAADSFARASSGSDLRLQARAYYNRGNALFHQVGGPGAAAAPAMPLPAMSTQELAGAEASIGEAIQMYENAIALDPKDLDAKANYELAVLKQQQIQQQKQQQQQQDQQNQDQQNQDQQKQNQQKQEEQQDQKQQQQQQQRQAQQQPQPENQPEDKQQQEEEQIQADKPSEEMTPEEAAMMLDAMKAQEQSQRDRLHPFFGRPVPVEKDW